MRAAAVALAVLASACAALPPPLPPPAPPPDDPAPPALVYTCSTACATQVRLGCVDEATASVGPDFLPGTADDISCVEACEVFDRAGLPLDVACLTDALRCGECDE